MRDFRCGSHFVLILCRFFFLSGRSKREVRLRCNDDDGVCEFEIGCVCVKRTIWIICIDNVSKSCRVKNQYSDFDVRFSFRVRVRDFFSDMNG